MYLKDLFDDINLLTYLDTRLISLSNTVIGNPAKQKPISDHEETRKVCLK